MRISVARTLAMVKTRWKQGAAFYNTLVTKSKLQSGYDPACRDCPRLAGHLDRVRQEHPGYHARPVAPFGPKRAALLVDRKSTRLNSSHPSISYAVFCLKKKKK